jgi:hypothetical protein
MKVRILRPALDDLTAGREFYERQGQGIGGYFLDSLFGEIDSLILYAGIHRIQFGHHRLLARRFPSPSPLAYRLSPGSLREPPLASRP